MMGQSCVSRFAEKMNNRMLKEKTATQVTIVIKILDGADHSIFSACDRDEQFVLKQSETKGIIDLDHSDTDSTRK